MLSHPLKMGARDGRQDMRQNASEERTPEGVPDNGGLRHLARDTDPQETKEWLDALEYVIASGGGSERSAFLLERLKERAFSGRHGVRFPAAATTPYVNTIPVSEQPEYPGDRDLERKIKSTIRWNAMAMVVRANRESPGIGGHISTYASAAPLYEVAFNPFFQGPQDGQCGGPT